MNKVIGIIFVLLVIAVSLMCYKISEVNREIALIEEKIAVERENGSKIEAELKEMQDNYADSSAIWELENARRWLLSPEESSFEETLEILEPLMTRDELFKWYVDCISYENYMTYISSSGVSKYKASYVRQSLVSPQEEWRLKDLYKTPEQSDINSSEFIATADITVPEELLGARLELEDFMKTMESVFSQK